MKIISGLIESSYLILEVEQKEDMTMKDGKKRVVIENVSPQVDCGQFPIKRVVGESVTVSADIFLDGHDSLSAEVLFRRDGGQPWQRVPMEHRSNDQWMASFDIAEIGVYHYTIRTWPDHFMTWVKDLSKKSRAGQDIRVDLLIGAALIEESAARADGPDAERLEEFASTLRSHGKKELAEIISGVSGGFLAELMARYPDPETIVTFSRDLKVVVDPPEALFSTWYEFFPRSCTNDSGKHGSLRECLALLPEISRMGFDVVYLPPIHPIGRTNRKGKNNTLTPEADDPGSPWAIGAEEGGHKDIHPDLGTIEDFEAFLAKAGECGISVALDIAFQCSPDHPYIKKHPSWFRWRPDGTIQYAENPPKKYEDIVPFNFETDEWQELWTELKDVVLFWIGKGITIFRVDNPHTKPFQFWDWLIASVKEDYPEVIFLAEAFTRPKVMNRLAKGGFTQSYTYFTWRNSKQELTEYLLQLSAPEVKEYFRPNFWPNTPDILHEFLQYGGRPAFMIRLVLAATLSSNYGIYGPAFEHLLSTPYPGKEEYIDSEKYEIRVWDWRRPDSLKDFIQRVNRIRKDNTALQSTWNVKFHEAENDAIIFYSKISHDHTNVLLIAVNLDPFHRQTCRVRIPLSDLGIAESQPYLVHDLLSDDKFIWQGEWNTVDLDPRLLPAHVFRVKSHLRREQDFDYFM